MGGFWCIYWDPCGLSCFTFGVCTILLINYVTQFEVLRPWFASRGGLGGMAPAGWAHAALFQAIVVMVLWAYFKAATTDPGSVEKGTACRGDTYPPAEDPERRFKPLRRYCKRCQCIKPPRAHHCSTCGRCINKMDHHCPWVNNCVGSNNMKFFLQFLGWTFVGCSYAAALAVWRAVDCWRYSVCATPPLQTLILDVAATVLAIFFAVFVGAMACDQYEGATTGTTAIESMKGWPELDRGLGEGLEEACGEPCGWRWLVPLPMPADSPSFYQHRSTDDPDAYDPRDPIIVSHFAKIRAALEKGEQPPEPQLPPPGPVMYPYKPPQPPTEPAEPLSMKSSRNGPQAGGDAGGAAAGSSPAAKEGKDGVRKRK